VVGAARVAVLAEHSLVEGADALGEVRAVAAPLSAPGCARRSQCLPWRSESLTLKSRMREICTSGSVGALGRNPQGDPATGRVDLPIDTVKRLLCDCSMVLVTEDEAGHPLDVGRKQRTVSTPLRRALYARDRGCTFPGCHRTRYLDGHHLEHWIYGGETSADNMTLLCTYHHRMLHEGGFSIVKQADATLRFVTADGRTIPRGGYRREDFVDDDSDSESAESPAEPSREGFCTMRVQRDGNRRPYEKPVSD
jgi:hypothetical protein